MGDPLAPPDAALVGVEGPVADGDDGGIPPGLVDAAGTADAVPGAASIPVVLLAGVAAAVPGALSTPVALVRP
ncbi:hypothetical protein [Mycolicibacterium iranicum]|uniref:Uncharacterized protein n=1 Tax=Mycolicibacterium iranicum TaxID=912594 RepID=A0ABT4HQ82_MYCIR|nr:hypothetical protein [Mycolicibacterium iranicum]MCZ0732353.1 hypothetical protein [Mycolicibacterium iranicum]